jgi:hypothetical protein
MCPFLAFPCCNAGHWCFVLNGSLVGLERGAARGRGHHKVHAFVADELLTPKCVMFTLCTTMQPTNPFIYAKHGNNQSGLRFYLRFTFHFAFAPSAHPSSVSKSSPIVVRTSLGRSLPSGGSCTNIRASLSAKINLSQLGCQKVPCSGVPLPASVSQKPCYGQSLIF